MLYSKNEESNILMKKIEINPKIMSSFFLKENLDSLSQLNKIKENSKKIPLINTTNNNNNNNNINNKIFEINLSEPKHNCTCSKTKCLKKYCECLAKNKFCNNCNCIDCHNIPNLQKENLNINISICSCSKSNCNKKYCECYKIGEKCNTNCRCINCFNKNQFIKTFSMERISVLIQSMKIYVEKKEIFGFNFDESDEEKFLSKKKNREN